MPYELVPLNAGDITERFFGLFGRSFKRVAVLFILVAIPGAVVMAVAMDALFSSVLDLISMGESGRTSAALIQSALRGFTILAVGILLVLLADVVILVAVQLVVCGEIVGRSIGVREAFELCSPSRLGRAVGQRILGETASLLAIIGPYLLIPVVIAAGAGAGTIVLVILVFVLALGLYLYLRVRWAFGTTTIAWEDQSVLGAFTRSGYLVRGYGWRVFGILAVFALVITVGLSMLLTPFQLWAFKDLFMLGLQESARNAAQQMPDNPVEILADIGFAYGLIAGGATLLQTVFKSIYLPILYFDLRARKGEFAGQPLEQTS